MSSSTTSFDSFYTHAPAKAIISGEHSVVYGRPGFATALSARMYCHFKTDASLPPGFVKFSIKMSSGLSNMHDFVASISTLQNFKDICIETVAGQLSLSSTELHSKIKTATGDTSFFENSEFEKILGAVATYYSLHFFPYFAALFKPTEDEDSDAPVSANDISRYPHGFMMHKNKVVDDFSQIAVINAFRSFKALVFLFTLIPTKVSNIQFVLKSDVPIGAGLGSSAALCVCLSSGIFAIKACRDNERLRTETADLDLKLLNHWARYAEIVIHNSQISGLDNTISTYGGFVRFGGKPITFFPPGSFPKEIAMIVVDTDIPKDTGRAVRNVADLVNNQFPHLKEHILSSMAQTTTYFTDLVKDYATYTVEKGMTENEAEIAHVNTPDAVYNRIAKLTYINQSLLRAIGVSIPTIDEMAACCERLGLAFKITGAGTGGSCIIFVPPSYKPSDSVFTSTRYTPLVAGEKPYLFEEDSSNPNERGKRILDFVRQFEPFAGMQMYNYVIGQEGVRIVHGESLPEL